jgi:acyl-CoA synthetase (AMP-forming)/AMP-acid ligase II
MDDSDGPLFESCVAIREPPSGTNMARELIEAFKRHSDRTLVVDMRSGRQWTGDKLLDLCARIATRLVSEAGVQVNDVIMTICDRNIAEVAIAIGVVLSGGAIYPTMPVDGYNEARQLCELVQPKVLIINGKYHERALKLCQNVAGMQDTKIVWIDGLIQDCPPPASATSATGVHHHQQATNGLANGSSNGKSADIMDENNNHDHNRNYCNGTSRHEPNTDQPKQVVVSLEGIGARPLDWALISSIAYEMIDAERHVCSYMLTSGSTGRPKVVPSSHSELVWGLYSMISAATVPFGQTKPETSADENNNNDSNGTGAEYLLTLSDKDVVAGDLPLDHGAGLNTMFLAFWLGAKYVVMPSFEAEVFWQSVNDHKITYSMSSTTFCFKLFTHLKRMIDEGTASRLDLSSIRNITCCGAKMLFANLVNEVQKHYPNILVKQSYGCTELGFIANLLDRDVKGHIDSVGYLMPGIKAKLVDPGNGDRQVGPEKRGELLIWSRSLFSCYRCHPDVDADEIYRNCHDKSGLFYRTGDQAHLDRAGRLYVHGRYKETLVLTGDWKIMPAELEAVVNEHPLVELSAVVGIPDQDMLGCHKPRAFVKLISEDDARQLLSAGSPADSTRELVARLVAKDFEFIAAHVQSFVADRTAPAKHLTAGVRILDEFPKVGMLEKIDRTALRRMD